MRRLWLMLLLPFLLLLAPAGDDEEDEEHDDEDEDDDSDEEDDDESEDDEDDEDDDDPVTDEERAEWDAERRRLNREAARYKRALATGQRPKARAQSTEERTARLAVREALVDAGITSKAAQLLDLSQVEMDGDELVDPEGVVEEVQDLLADLGVKPGRQADDDEDDGKPRKRASKRRVPRDRGTGKKPRGKELSTTDKLVMQARGESWED